MDSRRIGFVLGVPRSGTTLLRLMLAGNSRLFSPPEMVIAPFATMAQRHEALTHRFWEKGGLRRVFMELEGLDVEAAKARVDGLIDKTVPEVYGIVQALIGDRILVDKCPHLCGPPEALRRLDGWFPNARYIVILRNPASVIGSLKHVNMAEQLASFYGQPEQVWHDGNRNLRDFVSTLPAERWTRFHYEDLVRDGEPVMRQICRTLEVDFEPAMLDPYEGDRMRAGPKGAWPTGDPNTGTRDRIEPELADRWLASFDHRKVGPETRALARELGYDLDAIPLPAVSRISDAIGSLLDTTRAIEASIDLPNELDAIEGRRFLLRLVSAAIETFTEFCDPDRPRWHHFIGPTRKLFGDCPDCDYRRAPLRVTDGRGYKLTGRIAPGTTYLGLVLHGRGGRMGSRLNLDQLACDPAGRFEVRIGMDERPGSATPWLRCEGDETELVVRQYFGDRSSERAAELELSLEADVPPAEPLDASGYADRLKQAERMVKAVSGRIKQAYETIIKVPAKQFIAMPGDSLFPTPDNLYQVCWYRFGPGQMFVVKGRLPRARYFSLCLYNAWMESLDYTVRTVSLNHTQLKTDRDGRFTVILSDTDPHAANWLDTGGHDVGYLLARSLLLDGPPAELATETVWSADWRADLERSR